MRHAKDQNLTSHLEKGTYTQLEPTEPKTETGVIHNP